jgi:hypothetical protein
MRSNQLRKDAFMSNKPIRISARKAIILAAEHAGITPQGLNDLSLSYDEGLYSVYFCGRGNSYSYTIDAATGEIEQFSVEPFGWR